MLKKEAGMLVPVMDWLEPQMTSVETELQCGYRGSCIPDIVAAVFDKAVVKELKPRRPLARHEIVKRISRDRCPKTYHTDLVAVELKLTNFVQAYFQAEMYAWFGFRAYIAMPEGAWGKVKTIRFNVMDNHGIGFLEVGEKCEERLQARFAAKFNLVDQIGISDRMTCRFRDGWK